MSNQLFNLHAEVCKTLSHPKRLEILSILADNEMAAGNIVKRMKISKANVSQHLALLRHAQLVTVRRNGLNAYYNIIDPRIVEPCRILHKLHSK